MKRVELYGRVRHAVMIEGLSQREAARCFGIDPRTVRKMLSYSVPPGYVRTRPPVRPKLDPFIGIIDRILEEDKDRPKKQRHTSKRISWAGAWRATGPAGPPGSSCRPRRAGSRQPAAVARRSTTSAPGSRPDGMQRRSRRGSRFWSNTGRASPSRAARTSCRPRAGNPSLPICHRSPACWHAGSLHRPTRAGRTEDRPARAVCRGRPRRRAHPDRADPHDVSGDDDHRPGCK